MPYSLYEKLEDGEYDVEIETIFSQGTMKVCDYYLAGETKETIIFNAHNCHAAQANDDIAGLVAGIELMKRLSKRKNRFSYRLIIAPEHLGTVFYLDNLPAGQVKALKYCFFLEMLGNRNRLALQETFTGATELDRACRHYLKFRSPGHVSDKFRKIVGNDETVWEAPGYEIPTVSISRSPYKEYHTSMDNEDVIEEGMLEEAVSAVLGIVDILETNRAIKRNFKGLIALSNPKFDLYIAPGTDPSIPMDKTEDRKKWNYLMDCLPRYFDSKTTVLDIAEKHDIEYEVLLNYLRKFEAKGLITFIK
jgi:aminopeptidase-like protein